MHTSKDRCIQCKETPDNIIVLGCEHSICLDCCHDGLQETQEEEQFLVKCGLCEEQTVIDMPLYLQIQQMKISNRDNRHKSQQKDKALKQFKQNRQPNRQDVKWHKPGNARDSQFYQHNCSYHPECTIMYICLDCCNNLICPQCVVNGIHKSHAVLSIQKQGQTIKQQLSQLLTTLDSTLNTSQQQIHKAVESMHMNKNQVCKLKNLANRRYQEVMQMILKEKEQMMLRCDEIIDGCERQISGLLKSKEKQINLMEQKRIDILDMLNPFMKENMVNPSRALQRWHSVNMMKQYETFKRKYDHNPLSNNLSPTTHTTNNNANMTSKKLNRGDLDDLNKNITKISINDYKQQVNRIRMDCEGDLNKQKQRIRNDRKIYVRQQKKQDNGNIRMRRQSKMDRRVMSNNDNIFNLI